MNWRDLNRPYTERVDTLRSLQPHEILRVSCDASLDQIKAAYRNLAKVYHPDRSDAFLKQTNTELLKTINEAYTTMIRKHR